MRSRAPSAESSRPVVAIPPPAMTTPGLPASRAAAAAREGTAPADSEATPDINTSGASSVPIPLVVLGGMSLALLAAGGLGYLSRRRQAAAEELGDRDDDDDPTLG